jgi:plasmid stabilization system protein ParE
MNIAWTEPALGDLAAIHQTLARDSKPYASRVVDRLMTAVERARPVPRLGRVVQEVGDERIRELLFQTFRIIYRADEGRIVILSVVHGGRAAERRERRRWEVF